MMLTIPNLAPIFLKIPYPEFQIWEIADPESLVSGTTRPEIRLRAPNYESFLKIAINLRTRSFSSDNLPQKLVKASGY